jgi:outer membrane protein TolC
MDAQGRVARAASLPQAFAQAGYDLANPNPRVMPLTGEWKGTWSVGVGFQWTPFDGGRARAASAGTEALASAQRAQLRDLEERIRFDVSARALSLDTAHASLAVAAKSLEAARAAARVARDRYREGVGSSTDLLDAETREMRAALEQTAALSAIHLARAQLDRAVYSGR